MPEDAYGGSPSGRRCVRPPTVNPSAVGRAGPDELAGREQHGLPADQVGGVPEQGVVGTPVQPIAAGLLAVAPPARQVVHGAEPTGHDRTVADGGAEDGEPLPGEHVDEPLESLEVEGDRSRLAMPHSWCSPLRSLRADRTGGRGPMDLFRGSTRPPLVVGWATLQAVSRPVQGPPQAVQSACSCSSRASSLAQGVPEKGRQNGPPGRGPAAGSLVPRPEHPDGGRAAACCTAASSARRCASRASTSAALPAGGQPGRSGGRTQVAPAGCRTPIVRVPGHAHLDRCGRRGQPQPHARRRGSAARTQPCGGLPVRGLRPGPAGVLAPSRAQPLPLCARRIRSFRSSRSAAALGGREPALQPQPAGPAGRHAAQPAHAVTSRPGRQVRVEQRRRAAW